MANTFYGNIANKNKTSLQFDKIIESTSSLFSKEESGDIKEVNDIRVAADDGVFIGRNVLITNPENTSTSQETDENTFIPRQNDDGTVWQKRLVNGVITYVKIAELNPIPPSFLLVSTAGATHPIFTSKVEKEDGHSKNSTNWHQYIYTPRVWEDEIKTSIYPENVTITPGKTIYPSGINLTDLKDQLIITEDPQTSMISDTDGSDDKIKIDTGRRSFQMSLGATLNALNDIYNKIYPASQPKEGENNTTVIERNTNWIVYKEDGTQVSYADICNDSTIPSQDSSLAELYYYLKTVLGSKEFRDLINNTGIKLPHDDNNKVFGPLTYIPDSNGKLDAMSVMHKRPTADNSRPEISLLLENANTYISNLEFDEWGHIIGGTKNPITTQTFRTSYVENIHKLIFDVEVTNVNPDDVILDDDNDDNNNTHIDENVLKILKTENVANIDEEDNHKLVLFKNKYHISGNDEHTLVIEYSNNPIIAPDTEEESIIKYSVDEDALVVIPRESEEIIDNETFIVTEDYNVTEDEILTMEENNNNV